MTARRGEIERLARRIARAKAELAAARRRLGRLTRPGEPDVIVAPEWAWAQRLLEARRPQLMSIPGVVGCGLSFKIEGGVETGEPCVAVYVTKKWKRGRTRPRRGERRIPYYFRTGTRRLPTDVIELGAIEPHARVFAGASLGPAERRAGVRRRGTLGAYARDGVTDRLVALTAMHVMGIDAYDVPPGSTDFPVFHPSLADDGPHETLGFLVEGTRDGMDAAKIELRRPEQAAPVLPSIGPIRGWRPTTFPGDRGMPVRLYGARSGFRRGHVLTPAIYLPELGLDSAIVADIVTEGGDSGCALVDPENLVLGFLVGQAANGERVFCSISVILDRLDCEILT